MILPITSRHPEPEDATGEHGYMYNVMYGHPGMSGCPGVNIPVFFPGKSGHPGFWTSSLGRGGDIPWKGTSRFHKQGIPLTSQFFREKVGIPVFGHPNSKIRVYNHALNSLPLKYTALCQGYYY